jgi:predicted GIY-YIG superfamily endonuclease
VEQPSKRFVYILRSVSSPSRHYVGVTSNLPQRLESLNSGASRQTCDDRPWQFVVTLEFVTEDAAVRVEQYLKSGSGRAFAKKHFGEPFDVTTRVKVLEST